MLPKELHVLEIDCFSFGCTFLARLFLQHFVSSFRLANAFSQVQNWCKTILENKYNKNYPSNWNKRIARIHSRFLSCASLCTKSFIIKGFARKEEELFNVEIPLLIYFYSYFLYHSLILTSLPRCCILMRLYGAQALMLNARREEVHCLTQFTYRGILLRGESLLCGLIPTFHLPPPQEFTCYGMDWKSVDADRIHCIPVYFLHSSSLISSVCCLFMQNPCKIFSCLK
jgi:hypothetical protein